MSNTAGTVSHLTAHRARMSKLFFADGDHGFGSKTWYDGTFLDDDDDDTFDLDDMFALPPPPLPLPSPPPSSPIPTPPTSPASITSITPSIQKLADYINQMPKKKDGLPSRNKLRKDVRLAGEVSRKTGLLRVEKRGSRLRKFDGDERLFDAILWQWLTDTKEEKDEVDDEAFARELARDEMGLRKRPSRL